MEIIQTATPVSVSVHRRNTGFRPPRRCFFTFLKTKPTTHQTTPRIFNKTCLQHEVLTKCCHPVAFSPPPHSHFVIPAYRAPPSFFVIPAQAGIHCPAGTYFCEFLPPSPTPRTFNKTCLQHEVLTRLACNTKF